MFEHICRGQLENGSWIYGFYFPSRDGDKAFIANYPKNESILPYLSIVRRETIGMYTGYYDRLGERIYEHDLLKIATTLFKVVFENGAFVVRRIDGDSLYDGTLLYSWQATVLEKIGNIFDNSDLLR